MTAEATNERINRRVAVLERLLEEKGILQPGELDAVVDGFMARAMPLNGARLVVQSWLDDDFRALLLADAGAAAASLGMPVGPAGHGELDLRAVENTDAMHNVIVCTLCSCYPLRLLGTPPSWYKSAAYRSRVVRDPRGVLAEFGLTIAPDRDITVWDSTSHVRYMVLPRRPSGTEGMSEEQLAALVQRDALIGVAEVPSPA
ncbi:MAG: nitrile hydratase subunit alpha [Actinomycetota bacterium]|nr:nitrile hydratase subunit alpha [Actinomycetota bacterium]